MGDLKQLQDKDQRAELTLLKVLEGKSRQERKAFCKEIDCPWDTYQRLKRKYRVVLERWRNESKTI